MARLTPISQFEETVTEMTIADGGNSKTTIVLKEKKKKGKKKGKKKTTCQLCVTVTEKDGSSAQRCTPISCKLHDAILGQILLQ